MANPVGKDQLTVSSTAVGLTTANIPTLGQMALCYVEGAQIRLGDSDNVPTSTDGPIYQAGDTVVLMGKGNIGKARFIRDGSTDATLNTRFYSGFDVPVVASSPLRDDAGRTITVGAAAEDAAVAGNPNLMGGQYDTTLRTLDAGDVGAIFVDVDGRIQTALAGTVSRTSDQTANDSDKSFTVPAGKQWLVMGIYADFRPTGTAGNRRLQVQIDDGSDVIWRTYPDNLIPATNRFDMAWGPGFPLATATQTGVRAQYAPLPEFWLDAGWNLQILDAASVDGAADDLRLGLFYLERDSA